MLYPFHYLFRQQSSFIFFFFFHPAQFSISRLFSSLHLVANIITSRFLTVLAFISPHPLPSLRQHQPASVLFLYSNPHTTPLLHLIRTPYLISPSFSLFAANNTHLISLFTRTSFYYVNRLAPYLHTAKHLNPYSQIFHSLFTLTWQIRTPTAVKHFRIIFSLPLQLSVPCI